jgi:hypothetical protein
MPIILQDILDAQTAATDAQIASLTAQLATAQADLAAAQAQLGPLNAQVAALTAQVADLQAQIAALQPPVASTWNTGYRGPITGATVSGTITTDTVIENKSLASMAGFVVTGGANFTLRNCLLPYTGAYGIDAQGTGQIIIEDCSLRPTGASAGPCARGKFASFRRNKIDITAAGVGGLVLTGVSLVRDNYFWDVATGANFTAISGNQAGSDIGNNVSA